MLLLFVTVSCALRGVNRVLDVVSLLQRCIVGVFLSLLISARNLDFLDHVRYVVSVVVIGIHARIGSNRLCFRPVHLYLIHGKWRLVEEVISIVTDNHACLHLLHAAGSMPVNPSP